MRGRDCRKQHSKITVLPIRACGDERKEDTHEIRESQEQFMKIAVFSDVHGNLKALKAVLKQIGEENPDLSVFLGCFPARHRRNRMPGFAERRRNYVLKGKL